MSVREFSRVANEMADDAVYCALITIDEEGQPNARTMQHFPPQEDLVIWFGTNRNSRKVEDIRNNPVATVYFEDGPNGYLSLKGTAELVDDPVEKENWWMESWEAFYPDKESMYILIKFVPHELEIVSYRDNLTGDKLTWKAPSLNLER